MVLKTLTVGELGANCYILGCPDTLIGAVIDPGGDGDHILNTAEKLGLNIKYIINTHGHIDHIAANGRVKEATGADLLIHSQDAPMLTDSKLSLASFLGKKVDLVKADRLLEEGDLIKLGSLELKVIHTPGHTLGGICLAVENKLFTGDTLFAGSIGRTDFPGGDYNTLLNSIQEKLLNYGEETIVYPGHGPSSSIGEEKRSNPFFKEVEK